jgi:hypothetical protein
MTKPICNSREVERPDLSRPGGSTAIGLLFRAITARVGDFVGRAFDALESRSHQLLRRWVVWLSAGGFLFHLGFIFLARNGASEYLPIFGDLDCNYLHAIYTPFSVILFYEVLLLVLALPRSHSRSVGMQFQIISLIVVRRVFKDIGAFRDMESWVLQQDATRTVVVDMCGALAMFFLVFLFFWLRDRVAPAPPHPDLDRFLLLKKGVALLSCVVLFSLAAWNLRDWLQSLLLAPKPGDGAHHDLDSYFFPAFFEFMIFADVFLLIVSITYYDRYEYVFRNAGFVISTVLLRVSLSTPKPYDLLLGLIAMLYGLAVLGVFAIYRKEHHLSSEGLEIEARNADD